MNQTFKVISISTLICILFFVGCYNKRIVWSPDGQWGAICGDGGLYFTDSDGDISKNMHPGVYRATWFPDGRHLAIEEGTSINTWDELEKIVSDEDRKKYLRHAKFLRDVSTPAEWKAKTEILLENKLLSKDELTVVQIYFRDRAGRPFSESVLKSWNKDLTFYYHFLRIGLWDGKKFSIQKTLWSSCQRLWDMRISKHGRVVAFTSAFPNRTPEDEDERQISSLWVADRVSGKKVLLDQNVALYPDWNADGRTLVYVRSFGDSEAGNAIGTLLQIQVCNEQGLLLENFSKPKSLAGLVANEYTKVRCLSDGRVLFSSMELTLPIIGKDVPDHKQLFVLDLQRQATITRLIPRGTLDQTRRFNLDFFEVSPDESMVSLLDDEGRVGVLTMASGQFTMLQGEGLGDEVVVPVWRYPNDLCYVDKDSDSFKKVVLCQAGENGKWDKPRNLSKNWSKQVRQSGWLEMR